MYVCKKRRKKVQTVKNKIQVSDFVTVTSGWGQTPLLYSVGEWGGNEGRQAGSMDEFPDNMRI